MKIDITTILLIGGAAVAGWYFFLGPGKGTIEGMLGGLGGGGGTMLPPPSGAGMMDEMEMFEEAPPIKQAGTSGSGANMQHMTGHIGGHKSYLGQVSFY